MTTDAARARRGSPGFGVSGSCSCHPAGEMRHDRRRIRIDAAEPPKHVQGIFERRRIGHRRSRGDEAQIVADDVGNRERPAPARRARRELSSFDSGEVLAHRVERMDVGAGAEQGVGRSSLVVERQAFGGRRHQRRGAARQQHKQLFIGAGGPGNRERPVPRVFAGRRRHRMAAHDAFEGREAGHWARRRRRDPRGHGNPGRRARPAPWPARLCLPRSSGSGPCRERGLAW